MRDLGGHEIADIRVKLKSRFGLLKQTLKESFYLIEIGIVLISLISIIRLVLGEKRKGVDGIAQAHRSTRSSFIKRLLEPVIVRNVGHVYQCVHVDAAARSILEQHFGKRLLVLKGPLRGREKGVLYVMFSEMFHLIPRAFDMGRLLKDYRLVLEPSWAGYCNEDILHFTKYDDAIYVGAAESSDYDFLRRLESNLVPLRFGAGDWIDPRLFVLDVPSNGRKYDLLMNAHWGWGKRHYVLFRLLRKLPPETKVALIGFPWDGRKTRDLLALAEYYGVNDQITVFESVSYERVVQITAQCKIGLLLSLKEGANRAMTECMFCNVPVIVLAENIGGVKKNVNDRTGRIVPERQLASEIAFMLHRLDSYSPRQWALNNISCLVTSRILNERIKSDAVKAGEPWTQDLAVKTNAPELKYFDERDASRLQKCNSDLVRYCV